MENIESVGEVEMMRMNRLWNADKKALVAPTQDQIEKPSQRTPGSFNFSGHFLTDDSLVVSLALNRAIYLWFTRLISFLLPF